MSVRQSPLAGTPILFADSGASSHDGRQSAAAFQLALRLGATGIEADVWATLDHQPVLAPSGRLGRWTRRTIGSTSRAELGDQVVDVAQLLEWTAPTHALSLHLHDDRCIEPVIGIAEQFGSVARTWIRSDRLEWLTAVRSEHSDVRLIWHTALAGAANGPERVIASVRAAGVDAISLRHDEWTGGMVALAHRFRRLAFATDAQHQRIVTSVAYIGIDGISGTHVDRLVDGLIDGRQPSD